MASLRAAFIDFQQYGLREENALLRYANQLAQCELGPEDNTLPYGIVKREELVEFLVDCMKTGVIPILRLPYDQGFLFADGRLN